MTPAEPVRLAVVASADHGVATDGPLQYADRDAERVASVLVDLGGADPSNVWLVPGATVESVTRALGEAVVRSAALHAAGSQVELWVYYTGHAGADGLHLSGEVLPLTALKTAARVVPAAQRVFVVDACQAGQILRSKGATLVSVDDAPQEFQPPPDEAWIASAGAEESAFEVDQRRGALFTHFFVSGARGAADTDGDGAIRLSELYGFVHARTSAEAAGLGYVQEPRWAGELGDVVVARTSSSGVDARGPLPDPVLLVDERGGEVVAEIPAGAGSRLAVPPGAYQLVALGDRDRVEVGRVVVPRDGWVTTSPSTLRPARGVRTRGGLVDVRSAGLSAGVAVSSTRVPGAPVVAGPWLEGRAAVGRGVDLTFGGSYARGGVAEGLDGRADVLGVQSGARWDLAPGPWRAGPLGDLVGAAVLQDVRRPVDPVWGGWFGEDDRHVRSTVGLVAAHAGVGVDAPLGPAALTFAVGAGPAVWTSSTPRFGVDVFGRAGLEWGRR